MSLSAVGTVETKTWEETTYAESDAGLTFTRASISVSFQGGIEEKNTS